MVRKSCGKLRNVATGKTTLKESHTQSHSKICNFPREIGWPFRGSHTKINFGIWWERKINTKSIAWRSQWQRRVPKARDTNRSNKVLPLCMTYSSAHLPALFPNNDRCNIFCHMSERTLQYSRFHVRMLFIAATCDSQSVQYSSVAGSIIRLYSASLIYHTRRKGTTSQGSFCWNYVLYEIYVFLFT